MDQNAQVWPPKAALIMEMLERCPGCSVAREVEPKKAQPSGADAAGSTGAGSSRRCAHCGYDGPFPVERGPVASVPRDSMPSFAGARAKLATATQDLFRLSGSHSIPVEASTSEPPAPSVPEPLSSARKPEASIMFSLEALMKANQTPPPPRGEQTNDEASSQLWNMQSAEPLFGTAHDQALLTTPLKMEPAQSMDSMTLPSETPHGRRLWPILLAASAGLALAGAGVWIFRAPGASGAEGPSAPSSEQAALAAQLPAPVEVPAPPAAPAAEPPKDAPPVAAEPAHPATAEGAAEGEKAPAVAAEVEPEPAASQEPAKEKARERPSARKPPPRAVPSSAKPAAAFDKGAAKTALAAAASAAASCGAGGAPAKGKIQVTFAPSGKVSGAQLVEGPFAGTTAGTCAMRHFRAAKVPAFAGAPVTVAKSFKVD